MQYFDVVDAIVYVVGCDAPKRLRESLETLQLLLSSPLLANVPICVCLNKQDRKKLSKEEFDAEVTAMGINMNSGRVSSIHLTTAGNEDKEDPRTGVGIDGVLQWMELTFRNDPFTRKRYTDRVSGQIAALKEQLGSQTVNDGWKESTSGTAAAAAATNNSSTTKKDHHKSHHLKDKDKEKEAATVSSSS